MLPEDKPVTPPESQGMTGKENLELADEVYIPDYVMLDFGIPMQLALKGTRGSDVETQ